MTVKDERALILTFFGPAGAGKGTQASQLGRRFNLVHLSTGDLLRAQRQSGTPFGRKAAAIINRGELVDDEIMKELVKEETARILGERHGIIYDGYPRNINQLRDLECILQGMNRELNFGITLDIADEKLEERLSARRVCQNCQKVYNLIFHPPVREGICDDCGGSLIQRGDDHTQAIHKRLIEYRMQTEPMLSNLRGREKLRAVHADRSIEEVHEELVRLIENWKNGNGVA